MVKSKTATKTVTPAVKKEKIKTTKLYSSAVMVKDPLPQASDIFVETQVGVVTYDEATDVVTTKCLLPRYEAMFNRFAGMTYYIETNDAPIPILKVSGEAWVKNLGSAISLLVNEERNITFWATKPEIVSEEPVMS